jgi:hypothetical protein
MNRSKFVSALALTSTLLLAGSSQGADYAKKEELYIEYKQPVQLTISSSGINRISLYPFIATTIWGDAAEYSALLSHNGSELFLTSKLEAGKSFALAVQLAGGRVIDLLFNTIECDRPKIVHLDLLNKSFASSERTSEIKQLIEAMISKEKGKYYVVESRKKVKLNADSNAPLASLVAEQTAIYRYGDLIGVVLTLQNKDKKDVLIEAKSLSKAFKGVLAVSLHNQLLKKGGNMEAFLVLRKEL